VPRLVHQRILESADDIDRVLDVALRPGRHRPIGQTELPADIVEPGIDHDRAAIDAVTQMRQPRRVAHHRVELVAVQHQQPRAIGRYMNGAIDQLDATEMHAREVAQELVVIAGNIDDPRALARLPQKLLHDIAVALRPVPRFPEPPSVDDVADQVDRVGVMPAQEIDKPFRAAPARAKVEIGEKKGAEMTRSRSLRHRKPGGHRRAHRRFA
jgi:hypothetical protein